MLQFVDDRVTVRYILNMIDVISQPRRCCSYKDANARTHSVRIHSYQCTRCKRLIDWKSLIRNCLFSAIRTHISLFSFSHTRVSLQRRVV